MTTVFEMTQDNMDGLQQMLAKNFGAELANSIVSCMQTYNAEQEQPDYMEVKALSEMAENSRTAAKVALERYKRWKAIAKMTKFNHPLFIREGNVLKNYAVEQVKLFKETRLTFQAAYQIAMARTRRKTHSHALGIENTAEAATAQG